MEILGKTEPQSTAVHGAEMMGTGFSLEQGVQTGYKERIFPYEGKEQVLGAVMQSPALEYFKIKIIKALNNLTCPCDYPWPQWEIELEISNLNYPINHFLLTENRSKFMQPALIERRRSGIN